MVGECKVLQNLDKNQGNKPETFFIHTEILGSGILWGCQGSCLILSLNPSHYLMTLTGGIQEHSMNRCQCYYRERG